LWRRLGFRVGHSGRAIIRDAVANYERGHALEAAK
jgi:hypothetical protein